MIVRISVNKQIFNIGMLKLNNILILCSLLLLAASWQIDLIPCETANCTKCDEINQKCIECADGYFLDEANSACSQCSSKIDNCDKCSLVNTTLQIQCDACAKGYYPFEQGSSCRECGQEIKDCLDCSIDVNEKATCDNCVPGQFPAIDARSCQICANLVQHCITCQKAPKFQHTKCVTCEEGYELKHDNNECVEQGGNKTWIIIVAIVGAIVLIGIVLIAIKFCRKKKKDNTLLEDEDAEED